VLGAGSTPLPTGIHSELGLNLFPGLSVDDGVMLSLIAATLVWNAADIDRIGKEAVEVSATERGSPRLSSIEHRAQLGCKSQLLTLLLQLPDAPELEVELKQQPDHLGFFGIDAKLAIDGVIAKRHGATHPHALLLGGGDLVADPLARMAHGKARKLSESAQPRNPKLDPNSTSNTEKEPDQWCQVTSL
jgi:hypothetical protein